MVNTRRSESHSTRPHRTRGSTKLEEEEEEQDTGTSSAKEGESDTGRSNGDDETSSDSPLVKKPGAEEPSKSKVGRPTKVTKVVTIQRKFQHKFDANDPTRTTHNRISLERRRLAVYANRKMEEDDLLDNGAFSEEEYYPNSRTHRQSRLIKKNRMLRRSALSLRPISQKSYADHSPIHFDTDSDVAALKRRPRNIEGRSWLADSQMHKVGYPNLNVGYSEEDSRDAADVHENVEISQRVTRHSNRRRMVKPAYYYEEYDDVPQIRRTRRPVRRVVREVRQVLTHREPPPPPRKPVLNNSQDNNKEEGGGGRSGGGRTRASKVVVQVKKEIDEEGTTEDDEDGKSSKEIEVADTNAVEEEKGVVENGTESKDVQDNSLGSEEEVEEEEEEVVQQQRQMTRTLKTRQTRMMMRQEINRDREKVLQSESSESEEEAREGERKYSLRDRPPKAAPKTMQTSVLRPTRDRRDHRRRFTRRRPKRSSSSSSSSGSSDRCRKPPKSPHSKKDMMKSGAGGVNNMEPIKPETLDQSVRFNSIGGLQSHIQCLKEMILLPMMYPEVFRKFQVQPPRGVLFHGPPGTGKTLISRALANECSFGTRKVSFFMRKGADLLSKWIGESEKQLRLLFEQAAEMKPSIIFFDELDGLAPVRSSRQDQVHASIVSTLLALMDGLDDRGDVIVIGATNRIDAIDPALRRPGRFDRELFFPLPSKSEREEILKVHIAAWTQPPSPELLGYLAENTVGYCGSDMRALCSEAVIQSFRRTYPQVYESEHRLLLDPDNVKVEKVDFLRAKSMLVPASHRVASGLGKKMLPILEPLLGPLIKKCIGSLEQSFPHGLNATLSKVKLSTSLRPAQLLLTGDGSRHGQSNHVAPALLFRMEHIHAYLLDLATLFREPGRTPEEACIQVFTEAKRNIPSIIYIPSIDHWWDLVSDTVKAIFLSQMKEIDPNIPIMLLATSDVTYTDLQDELRSVFSLYRKEIQEVRPPNAEARRLFFKGLLIDTCLKPMRQARERPKTPPPLPRAPTPPPAPLTEDQAQKLYETEEHTLRELRIFLRDMCKKLGSNKLFFMFTKPVDTEEVPDYTEIIKQPMDLETMMMKVDLHRYECAKDFLYDIDLICQNALEYNPARSSADKQIRHRACSLRDYAYTLIKTEMDSDFEDKCRTIKHKRKQRKACTSKYLPPYIVTPDVDGHKEEVNVKAEDVPESSTPDRVRTKINGRPLDRNRISPIRKRKFNTWQHGYVKKNKKPKRDPLPQQCLNKSQKEKQSSDESKENDPDSSTMEVPPPSAPPPERDTSSRTVELNTALSINCDTHKAVSSSRSDRSPNKMPPDLLSPSELLDSPLYFDDVDQALNENASDVTKRIDCSEIELEKVLDSTVKTTDGLPLTQLLDLYNQFTSIIKKFSKTHVRHTLPKELAKELVRFRKSNVADSQSSPNTSKPI